MALHEEIHITLLVDVTVHSMQQQVHGQLLVFILEILVVKSIDLLHTVLQVPK